MPVIDGEIIDNTNGYLSKFNTYYLIKEYFPKDLKDTHMTKLLDSVKDEYLNILFTPKEIKQYEIKPEHI
jgi:hypothetical protein